MIFSFKLKVITICVFTLLSMNTMAQDLTDLYEKVRTSVVVIYTHSNKLRQIGESTSLTSSQGLGSGFLIGHSQVVTAAHVVDTAEKLFVEFTDGDVIEATVESSFSDPDVALLKLQSPKMNPSIVQFGDSDKVKIGERVVVVGSPFGLGQSLSSGYISSRIKKKEWENPFTNSEYLQTDAAINKGNSGGPMFNLKGEVIGIVSHITTVSGGFDGIGFAASSNIAQELLLEKKIPWSGAKMVPLTPEMLKLLNITRNGGLLVEKVVATSRYGRMGLRGGTWKATLNGQEVILGGDIILTLNNIPFEMTDSTLKKLGEFADTLTENTPIFLEIMREGKIMMLSNDK